MITLKLLGNNTASGLHITLFGVHNANFAKDNPIATGASYKAAQVVKISDDVAFAKHISVNASSRAIIVAAMKAGRLLGTSGTVTGAELLKPTVTSANTVPSNGASNAVMSAPSVSVPVVIDPVTGASVAAPVSSGNVLLDFLGNNQTLVLIAAGIAAFMLIE